ncbi:MAG: prepilin-type N-terminal cleavage/methylation domain-containing protein [Candidatus Parcubacteria bacterium]|nr:prepilin-type N-terminal cleavage/methylation domain-containing protein [Burkholderiales bacterium]
MAALFVRTRGFTLIETLVVLAIITVLSLIVIGGAKPGEATLIDREARRLAALLELGLTEARASGRGMAWSPEGGGYAFWRKNDEGEWARFPESSIYRGRSFEGKAELRDVLLDGRGLGTGERMELLPHALPGTLELTIAAGDARIGLRGGALGRIVLKRDAEPRLYVD